MKKLIKWLGILSFFVVVLATVATIVVQAIEDAEERHAVEDTIERQQTEGIENSPISIDEVTFLVENRGAVYWSDEEGQSGNISFRYEPSKNEVEFLGNESSEEYPYARHYKEFVEAISAHY
ncbi:hypothetical protein [Lacticigenium naphthae]|uniref:hypothetical protein n=1 Tax=Lacticigenium naphthae TaxID=515351 RepID=UPI000410AB54|nr:hypothetical protein [Lacticigenium naphthae]